MDGASSAAECRLLAGPASVAAQVALLALVIASLAYKRHKEHPRRTLQIWGLDVSKQLFSSGAAHICGMLVAILAHGSAAGASSSECAWYFVVFSLDTTLGVALAVSLHGAALRAAGDYCLKGRRGAIIAAAISQCGSYGDPPEMWRWSAQMGVWVLATILARLICGCLVILCGGALSHVAAVLDWMFYGHPTLLLFSVMVACPLGMNLLQAWVQDAFLKLKVGRDGSGAFHDTYRPLN